MLRAKSVVVSPLKPKPTDEHDLLVASLGFEQRASFLASKYSSSSQRKVACGFASRKVHSYERNRQVFATHGFEMEDCAEEQFQQWWQKTFDLAREEAGAKPLRLCVDVSSMSRYRIATIVGSLLELGEGPPVVASFLYSIAKFSPPPPDGGGPIVVCAPATRTFSGWSTEPDQPSVAILGLGYEEGKAVGVLEFLEPKYVWIFRPTGEDRQYDLALEKANANLWAVVPPNNIVTYTVANPFEYFGMLESLVYGQLSSTRVTLVPFGPKIFNLSCLLVACVHWPKVAVWRVSSDQNEPAVDRIPSGKVIGLRAVFA